MSEKSKRRTFTVSCLSKKLKLLKKLMDARAHTTLILVAIQSERSFSGEKFNNPSRNNWTPLFEVNFRKNSTKTIRLFAIHFYDS